MTVTGTVAGVRRYPVVAMGGERLVSARVGATGLLGDRAFAVVDAADGSIATVDDPERWAGLLAFTASYGAEPEPGLALPPVTVAFPDGSVLRSDDENVHAALSEILGREVSLRACAPPAEAAPVLVATGAAGAVARPHLLLDVAGAADDTPGVLADDGTLTVGVADEGVVLRMAGPVHGRVVPAQVVVEGVVHEGDSWRVEPCA